MDSEHGLAWCENYKVHESFKTLTILNTYLGGDWNPKTTQIWFQVGSSTWAEQLLRLKGVSIKPTTQIHKVIFALRKLSENPNPDSND